MRVLDRSSPSNRRPPSWGVFDRSSHPITNPIGWRRAQLIAADGCRLTVSNRFRKHGTATARCHKTPSGFPAAGRQLAACNRPPTTPRGRTRPHLLVRCHRPAIACPDGGCPSVPATARGPPSVVRRRAVAADSGGGCGPRAVAPGGGRDPRRDGRPRRLPRAPPAAVACARGRGAPGGGRCSSAGCRRRGCRCRRAAGGGVAPRPLRTHGWRRLGVVRRPSRGPRTGVAVSVVPAGG